MSYSFGMQMPGRKYSQGSTNYRYGFNGQEKSDEIKGEGNSYTAEFWEYDSRTGRRWNVDPKPNVSISPYNCFAGNPIMFRDILGDTLVLPSMYSSFLGVSGLSKFGMAVQGDFNELYETKAGRSLIRVIDANTVKVKIVDADRFYFSNKNAVLSSETKGDYPQYYEARKKKVTVSYASKSPIFHSGLTTSSYLVLAHELVHANDIANGYFTKLYEGAKDGLYTIKNQSFANEIAEVRALMYTNAIRIEKGLPIQTKYTVNDKEVELINKDNKPIKDYGVDITKNLFINNGDPTKKTP